MNNNKKLFIGPVLPKGKGKKQNAQSQKKRGASRNQSSQKSVAAAYSTGNSGKAPNVTMAKDSCRVVHRELLGNVSGTGSTAFVVASTFALNPGLAQTFPWLSNMAQNWETYRFNKLRVCYYTRTGSNTAGSVIIVPDYDASDSAPLTEQTASSYEDVQEDAPWKDIICTMRPSALMGLGPRKFIRAGALSANQDLKTCDGGNLFVCTVDSAGAASWGKLWIEYDVTFFTPQLFPGGSNFANQAVVVGAPSAGLTQTNLFGTAPVISGNFPCSAAGNIFTITGGLIIGAEYSATLTFAGTVISAVALSGFVGLNTKSNDFVGFNAAATGASQCETFTATALSGSLTYTCTATTVTACQLIFTLIPTATI